MYPQRRRPLPWLFFPLAAVLGCGEAPPDNTAETSPPVPGIASRFDPKTAGTITGRVTWTGPVPAVPPFEVRSFIMGNAPGRDRRIAPNPNAPKIDPVNRGVAGAVVFLRGVRPDRAKPWDHPPVRVEQRDCTLHVLQGGADGHVGFVRRGEPIEMVAREPRFHALHASGAAFFTLAFPDADRPRVRRLTSSGVVELTSAAGYYWMRAYLFVDEQPYYTRTNAQGKFRLEQVPPGRYELVCWLPSWVKERHERDPETSLVTRLAFRPPLERPLDVSSGAAAPVEFTLSTSDFEK